MDTSKMNGEARAIYNEGARAYSNGLSLRDNPYRGTGAEKCHKLWKAGWESLERHDDRFDRSVP